ncbi:MAG TPA: hypothetical protein VGH33_02925 [Isosphaeraceae bacterium]
MIGTPLAKNDRLRIAVLGYIVRGPFGGMAWHHLQYLIGLRQLGHDVLFVEDSDDFPSCYDPSRGAFGVDPAYGLRFAGASLGPLGLGDRWAYHDAHGGLWLGPRAGDAVEFCRSADLVLNVSGVNPLRPWLMEAPARVFIDTDPAFTQIRHLEDHSAAERAGRHTAFFTFGEAIAAGRSFVPVVGLPWLPTRQPIALDAWPAAPLPDAGAFTTVMHWESYPARTHHGVRYGLKADAFGPYESLPERVGATFELALGGDSAPRERLAARGWGIVDPRRVADDAWSYRRYLRRSRGEFAVAKHGYVVGRTGWFSERSACYLASGRPVVVQDTGFPDWLECGAGVHAFRSPEGAAGALEEVIARAPFHARAAREIASAYFDARRVLARLINFALDSNRGARPRDVITAPLTMRRPDRCDAAS